MGSNEIIMTIVDFVTGDMLWVAFAAIVIVFYLLTSLLSFSLINGFRYVGVPSIIAGIIFVLMYLSLSFLPFLDKLEDIVKILVKPFLEVGLICLVMGISMIIVAKVLSRMKKRRKLELVTEENPVGDQTIMSEEITKETTN